MTLDFTPATGLLASLDLLRIEVADSVAHVQLNRPDKRNAISDIMVRQIQTVPRPIARWWRAATLRCRAAATGCASPMRKCSTARGASARRWRSAGCRPRGRW